MSDKILLGFEIGTGKPVYVENTHIIITGLTNKSGKTTAIEALADRSERRVLVFITKPGEQVFADERLVAPFYQEKSDWQYVESILEAVMKERMKFERAWIIRATKGTKSLKEVDANCQNLAAMKGEGTLENNVFSTLHAYFEIVLPQLRRISFSPTFPKLEVGINVMNLSGMSDEVQALIIRACLDHIVREEEGIITVMPELWKFAPEGRGNPVKIPLEVLIRQGATKKNFVWTDSQDLAGVDKQPLKQVYTWLLGLQTEKNEVKHTLDQLPLPKKSKPGPEEIMTLQVGRFILATPKEVKRVYVMPSWMSIQEATAISLGQYAFLPERPSKRFEPMLRNSGIPEYRPGIDAQIGAGEPGEEGSLDSPDKAIKTERAETTRPAPSEPSIDNEALQSAPTPRPSSSSAMIDLDEKTLIVNVSHSEEPIASFTTRDKEGALIAVLRDNDNRPMIAADLCRGIAEYGVYQNPVNFARDIANPLIAKGFLILDGRTYRLPRKVKFQVKDGPG